MEHMTTILGVDPGTARIGWGLIEERGGTITAKAYGCITTDKIDSPSERLSQIYTAFTKLLKTYTPDHMSVEDLFFATNAKTAIAVGQARGIVLLCAGMGNVPVTEYSGPAVKLMVAGEGRAKKKQVHEGVRKFLSKIKGEKAAELSKPMAGTKRKKTWDDNAVDAVAIAICHVLKLVAK